MTGPGSKERIGRDEIYGKTGDPATEGLRTAAEVFGRDAIDPFVELVRTRPGLNASLTLTDNSRENPLTYTVVLTTDGAAQSLAVKLEGNWSQNIETPRGIPCEAGFSGKFTLINSISGEPFVKPNDWIPPEGRIGNGTKGKESTFGVRLPGVDFPGGGNFRGYVVVDGQTVEPGTVLYYVERVEVLKK